MDRGHPAQLAPYGIGVSAIYPNGISGTEIFRKAGIDRDITNGLAPLDVAQAIVFMCTRPPRVSIPDMSIEIIGY